MSERLVMSFGTELGKKTSISVYNPKDDLNEAGVRAAMQAIIDANIFTSGGGNLTDVNSAKIITTNTTVLVEAE